MLLSRKVFGDALLQNKGFLRAGRHPRIGSQGDTTYNSWIISAGARASPNLPDRALDRVTDARESDPKVYPRKPVHYSGTDNIPASELARTRRQKVPGEVFDTL